MLWKWGPPFEELIEEDIFNPAKKRGPQKQKMDHQDQNTEKPMEKKRPPSEAGPNILGFLNQTSRRFEKHEEEVENRPTPQESLFFCGDAYFKDGATNPCSGSSGSDLKLGIPLELLRMHQNLSNRKIQ